MSDIKKTYWKEKRSYNAWSLPPSKEPGKTKYRGSWEWWCKTIHRLNVFMDLWDKEKIQPGVVENSRITLDSRLKIYHVFKEFMSQYEGKSGDELPFNPNQLEQIKHILAGGLLTMVPEK